MDVFREQDRHEERLKELFSSFDATGCGSLRPEELAALCVSLHLDDATPALLDSLLHERDRLTARVDFHQFKDALILVLSSGIEATEVEQDPPEPRPESPEIQPKLVKGGKRYDRRSTPEFVDFVSESCGDNHSRGEDATHRCDSTVPRKREPFDEVGRRIATPSALMSTIGMPLFSRLDDGTGFTPVDSIMDLWMEEGVENGTEILQALNFRLDGKLSLCDLAAAIENQLLAAKDTIHRAALASFKAEIRHLLERVDGELREKEKLRSDLEKAERLKNQLATEGDEHLSSIELANNLHLRKLERDHREKLATVRSEMTKEMDQIRQQAAQQREDLEAQMEKLKDHESVLKDRLSISVKENRRLEMELLDCSGKLMEAEGWVAKLRASLDNIVKGKLGELDPASADFLLQEERMRQLRLRYEAHCRELQDCVDELQSKVRDFNSLGCPHQSCHKPFSEELESKSPAMESDTGLGSEEVHSFSLSLEAEMMLQQQTEQHLQQLEQLRKQLEGKICEFQTTLEQQRATHQDQKDALALQYKLEVQALREELDGARELQNKLKQAPLEQTHLEEVCALRLQLLEAQTSPGELEEHLRNLQDQPVDQKLLPGVDELREMKNVELLESRLKEERNKHQEEKDALVKSWLDGFEREKQLLRQSHEVELRTRLEEARSGFEEEQGRTVQRLTQEWQKERARLDEQNESLQRLLEEETLSLLREQEEKEIQLREQWESERAGLLRHQEEALLKRLALEREEHESRERELKSDHEGKLRERLDEEREKHRVEKEEIEERLRDLMDEEASHREALQEMTLKHAEERSTLSGLLDELRHDITQERHTLEQLSQEKLTGEQAAEEFNRQVSDLRSQSRHLQSKNKTLPEKNARSRDDADSLKMQLAKLRKDSDRREAFAGEEKKELAACMRSLEAELTKALKDTAGLEDRNFRLAHQVSELQEKVKASDETLQTLAHQRACLKSELRVAQQNQDAVLQKVAALHKQLQNSTNKNRVLEQVLHQAGLQSHSKNVSSEEQDDKQVQSDFLSHRQQRPSSVIRAQERENASLRREVDAQKLVIKDLAAGEGLAQTEKLQEENKTLKDQVERLTTQLLEGRRRSSGAPTQTSSGGRAAFNGDDKKLPPRRRNVSSHGVLLGGARVSSQGTIKERI